MYTFIIIKCSGVAFGVGVHFSTPSQGNVLLGAALKPIWRMNARIRHFTNDFWYYNRLEVTYKISYVDSDYI